MKFFISTQQPDFHILTATFARGGTRKIKSLTRRDISECEISFLNGKQFLNVFENQLSFYYILILFNCFYSRFGM